MIQEIPRNGLLEIPRNGLREIPRNCVEIFTGFSGERFLGISADSWERFLGISADFPQNCYLGRYKLSNEKPRNFVVELMRALRKKENLQS